MLYVLLEFQLFLLSLVEQKSQKWVCLDWYNLFLSRSLEKHSSSRRDSLAGKWLKDKTSSFAQYVFGFINLTYICSHTHTHTHTHTIGGFAVVKAKVMVSKHSTFQLMFVWVTSSEPHNPLWKSKFDCFYYIFWTNDCFTTKPNLVWW